VGPHRRMEARVEMLEARAESKRAALRKANQPKVVVDWERAMISLITVGYSGWEHHGLSLEQLLVLARDNGDGECAREFEVQLLLRDARIDEETAKSLRANYRRHYRCHTVDGATKRIYDDPLEPLPQEIEFDEVALSVAREQCPLDGSVSPEKELQLREDHLREIRTRDLTEPRPYGTTEKISDDLALALGRETMAQKIAKLKDKIAARDSKS
jgi:hypothetical protein